MGDMAFSLQDLLVPPLPTQDYGGRDRRGGVAHEGGLGGGGAARPRLQVGAGQDTEGERAGVGAPGWPHQAQHRLVWRAEAVAQYFDS